MLALILFAVAAPGPQDATNSLLIDRNRLDRRETEEPTVTPESASQPKTPATIAAKGSTTPIERIKFVGTEAPGRVADAARPFIGRAASTQTLTELAAALSAAYGKSATALYSVSIPEQNLDDGVVEVRLTEGRIVSIDVKDAPPRAHRLMRARLARQTHDQPLSRATLERQFTLIRQTPGLTITPAFAPTGDPGALALSVVPKQKKSEIKVGFSNRGVALLGDGQLDVKARFYGLASDGDTLSIDGAAASDFRRFRYVGGGYSVPLTASGLTLSGSAAYLETRPRGIDLRGTAKIAGLSLSYPWLRSFTRSGDLSLGIDGLDSSNAAFSSVIASERTRAIRGAASYAIGKPRRSLSLAASVSRGLAGIGADVPAISGIEQYWKFTGSADLSQAVGKRIVARLGISGQYSADALPAAERFSAGGETIGRAFDVAALSGDRGVGGVTEVAYRPFGEGRLATSEVYLFADGAVAGLRQRPSFAGRDAALASTGIGGRLRYRDKAELGLELARALQDPTIDESGDDWRVSVAWRLKL